MQALKEEIKREEEAETTPLVNPPTPPTQPPSGDTSTSSPTSVPRGGRKRKEDKFLKTYGSKSPKKDATKVVIVAFAIFCVLTDYRR